MAWHPRERAVLADALAVAGPGSPTLCEGWRTEHLAAHVVLRERDLLASAGIALAPLTARTDRVTLEAGDRAADADSYARLVAEVRAGPPLWSPLRWAGDLVQLLELFVHAEDVLRAPGAPTGMPDHAPSQAEAEVLWRHLVRSAPLMYRAWLRRSGLVLAAPGRSARVGRAPSDPRDDLVVHGGLTDLVLHAFGRTSVAKVELEGTPDHVSAVTSVERRA
jgi:uncharacterized protein (TIGR03085 family)